MASEDTTHFDSLQRRAVNETRGLQGSVVADHYSDFSEKLHP